MKNRTKWVLVIGLVALIAISLAACGGEGGEVQTKATTPAEVADRVEFGMTSLEAMEKIAQEYFVQNHAFAVVRSSKLEIAGDALIYEAVKGEEALDSPYYLWLFFGVIVQDMNPTVVGFEAGGDTVVVVTHIPFHQAQRLVD